MNFTAPLEFYQTEPKKKKMLPHLLLGTYTKETLKRGYDNVK